MKTICTTTYIDLKEAKAAGVTVDVDHRIATVKGPRNTLVRNFKHANLEFTVVDGGDRIRIDMWFATNKQLSVVNTISSHIKNMIIGVTQGFRYKMRLVYSHFPINATIEDKGKMLAIRNFLGEKAVREIQMLGDTIISKSTTTKDELVLEGSDVEHVSRTAALIYQSCLVKDKDIRKFLDGIFVSEKGPIPKPED